MHLICVPGLEFHTYGRQMSVISQDIAQNIQKRFINFYYTHEGRHCSKLWWCDSIFIFHRHQTEDRMPQNSSKSLKYSTPGFSSEQRRQGWVHLWLVLNKAIEITGKQIKSIFKFINHVRVQGILDHEHGWYPILHSTEIAHFHHSSRKSSEELWTQPCRCWSGTIPHFWGMIA
jgi:hypothetical protein